MTKRTEKILTEIIWAVLKPFWYAWRWIKLFVTSVWDWCYYNEVYMLFVIVGIFLAVAAWFCFMTVLTGWN